MIQRKQTLYLLVAIVLQVIAMCLPLGTVSPVEMGAPSQMFNIMMVDAQGAASFHTCPLFIALFVACDIQILTIFKYNNRRLQMKLCSGSMMLLVLWYVLLAAFVLIDGGSYKPQVASVLPAIGIILTWLARRGVQADERLVRAADRIR